MANKPAIYEESSQYQHWRFSPEQLWDIRNKRTTEAIERVKKGQEKQELPNKMDSDYLSAKEELELCRFYEKQLQVMCTHCKFSEMVMATSVIYMKRFFLYKTVMDHHPKDIFLTCLFLATKSESERISIEDFGKKLRLPSTVGVLGMEFTVSQGLRFEYYVHHPFRPAYGLFLDMQAWVDTKVLKAVYKQVMYQIVPEMLLKDLPLIYQPSQLALAAFVKAGEEQGCEERIQAYVQERFGEDALLANLTRAILERLASEKSVTQEEAKKIDYRLRIVTNPDSAMMDGLILI
ncbi:cyclin-like protein [Sporodiniella umbellata]|nr:cyclin-like protein [Sporodiniella umbellata]